MWCAADNHNYMCHICAKGVLDSNFGIGQYFEILFLAEFHLSCKMQLLIYEYKKKNSKIPSEN